MYDLVQFSIYNCFFAIMAFILQCHCQILSESVLTKIDTFLEVILMMIYCYLDDNYVSYTFGKS